MLKIFVVTAFFAALLPSGFCQDNQGAGDAAIRLANGVALEGAFKAAAPEGLTVETARGTRVVPWKYLSAGTRWRYERPMLAELERQRILAEKAAKAKAEAAAKAAAAKAAAAKKAAVATNKAVKAVAPVAPPAASIITNKPPTAAK